jgi:hypothetical protein
MQANENFKSRCRELLHLSIEDKESESQCMWMYRTLQVFEAAVEIAESRLKDGELLSEQLIIENASLSSFEAYVSGVGGKNNKVLDYLNGLPLYYLEGFNASAAMHHKFAMMALEDFLLPGNDARKKVCEANAKFAEWCKETITNTLLKDDVGQMWGPRAIMLIDASMEILGEPQRKDCVITMTDIIACLQIPVMAIYALIHPDSIACRYLDGLPGFEHGVEPGYETIREHQYTLVGLKCLLGASASA